MAISIHKIFFVTRFRIWGFWYSLFMKRTGKRLLMQKPVYITPKFITCGHSVTIYNNARIEGVEKYNAITFSPEIKLDDDVSIQQNVHITCANLVWIKQHTAIAANVSITDINHPYKDINLPVEKQDIEVGFVEIGEDCKIYNNVVILPNVKLGKHCIVGANSVVSAGQYPDYSVLAGSPAKIVKRYNVNTGSWEKVEQD
jgi:acetyltransferase-like isoleucine patch superfamily enzyme